MPDEPADAAAESADLSARLKAVEDRIAEEEVPAAHEAPAEPPEAPAEQPPDQPVDPPAKAASAPKKAPAKRAPAKRAPRSAAPPRATPVTKAPAKKAAKKAGATKAPTKAPAKKNLAKRPASAVGTPWPVGESVRAPLPLTRAVPGPPVPVPVVAEEPGTAVRERDGLFRFLVALAVLLLAAAAGLGAAALVEHRDRTYESRALVRIDPGPDPSAPVDETVAAGVTKYTDLAATAAFTRTAALRAELPTGDVKGDIDAKQGGENEVALSVSASTAKQARALAVGAGDALVEAVNLQEAVDQSSPGDRLAAAVVEAPGPVTKTAPKDRDAWIAALLAAGAVVVLGGLGALVRFTRRD